MSSSASANSVRVSRPSDVVSISWVAQNTIIVVENGPDVLAMEQFTADRSQLKKLVAQLCAANHKIEVS